MIIKKNGRKYDAKKLASEGEKAKEVVKKKETAKDVKKNKGQN
jgi:hypothetical protein